jgi:feruloyl esterase
MRTHSPILLAVLLLAACSTPQLDVSSLPPAQACAVLTQPVEPALIGLPSGRATIESAQLIAPSPVAVNPKPPFAPTPPEAAVIAATPEYCKVLGSIAPLDRSAPPIRFQVNLPTNWNQGAVQFGGGGFNGVLITAAGLIPSARPDMPSPLLRGYATFGTDSGHQNAQGVPLQAFALNDEALANFSYASYKKVRDVAVELIHRRYGAPPKRVLYVGSSEGGREGLMMAQRFPDDYDGIFSRVPVINWVGLQAAGTRAGVLQMQGGWLPPEKVKLVSDAVLAACDARDGLADGIVSDYAGCRKAFDATKLRCSGADAPSCLTDAQLKTVQAIHSPYTFPFELANGVRSYPGWGVSGEAAQGTGPVGGWPTWQTGSAAPTLPPGPASSRAWLYGSGAVQYFFARDPKFDPRRFDPAQLEPRLRDISVLMDATDPDLTAFAERGGKLIISEHMADYAQSPYAGIQYYESLVARIGQPAVDNFVRLYVTPGADHMGQGAPSNVDMLQVLEDWMELGKAPVDLVQVKQNLAPPFEVTMARPMCRYPAFPRYRGSGDPARAESFECVRP